MNGKVVLGASILILAVVGVGVWQWIGTRDRVLSDMPPRSGVAADYEKKESTIGVRVAIPFTVLNEAVNAQIPPSFSGSGSGDEKCVDLLIGKACAKANYSFTATKTKPVMVQNNGGMLRATTSIDLAGSGGLSGDVAKILKLDKKNFEAAADLVMDMSLSLTKDWCLNATLKPTYTWTKSPRIEIIDNTYITVADAVDGKVNEALKGLSENLTKALPCDKIKAEVAKVWQPYDIPVDVPDGPQVHVLLNPSQIGTSGLVVDDAQVRIAVAVVADTAVSTSPSAQEAKPLPELGAIPDEKGRLALSLPVHIEYAKLNELIMSSIGNKDMKFNVSGNDVVVNVSAVDVYPSAGAVAVGIDFMAELPYSLFDTKGRVYAIAKPMVGSDGLVVSLEDFQFARIVDSKLLSSLSAAFEGAIKDAVKGKLVFDLTNDINKGVVKLQEALSDPSKTKGVKIEVTDPTIKIASIVPEEKTLTAVIDVGANLDTTITDTSMLK